MCADACAPRRALRVRPLLSSLAPTMCWGLVRISVSGAAHPVLGGCVKSIRGLSGGNHQGQNEQSLSSQKPRSLTKCDRVPAGEHLVPGRRHLK